MGSVDILFSQELFNTLATEQSLRSDLFACHCKEEERLDLDRQSINVLLEISLVYLAQKDLKCLFKLL